MTLNAKQLVLGFDTVPFVGHKISAPGIDMSKKRIENAISFSKPNSLKELQSFLDLVNYFKDHSRDHSAIAKPLYDMITITARNKIKQLTWTNQGHVVFERLKAFVNVCPKLYVIDYSLRIILYTDASEYAHWGVSLPTSTPLSHVPMPTGGLKKRWH